MRLRSRAPRAPEPAWAEVGHRGPWTTIGTLDGTEHGGVDASGLVAWAGRPWAVDWWIGAEDRWHVPAREAAVRQSLLDNSPVVETRVRVPSGDAVQRAYAALGPDGEDVLVLEVHNDSKVPFAVAVAVRPYGLTGPGAIHHIELDGASVRVDGALALALPRAPGRMVLADGSADAAEVVVAGAAEAVRRAEVRDDGGRANAALLFPLAHTATLRIVLPAGGAGVDGAALPSAAQVASGWGTLAGQGARIEVPNRRLRDAIAASTRALLLAPAAPAVAAALDLVGLHDDAARRLAAAPLGTDPGRHLAAVVRHWALTRAPEAAAAAVPLVATLVPRLARTDAADAAEGHAALPAAVALLAAAGEPRAAADARALAATVPVASRPTPGADLEALLRTATSTWTWADAGGSPDPLAPAALLDAVRHLLVQEVDEGLALSPSVPPAWLGQGWEVHDLPTGAGRLSFAVRWHGERPALLWELEPHDAAVPTRMTIPGLDPAWTTTDARGEALLAAVAVPERTQPRRGLTIPVTIEPMRRGRS